MEYNSEIFHYTQLKPLASHLHITSAVLVVLPQKTNNLFPLHDFLAKETDNGHVKRRLTPLTMGTYIYTSTDVGKS